MSFAACLQSAVDQKEISPEEMARLKGLYDAIMKEQARAGIGGNSSAKAELIKLLAQVAEEKKRVVKLAIRAQNNLERDLGIALARQEKPDAAGNVVALFEDFNLHPFSSAEGIRKSVAGEAHARMESLLFHFRRGAVAGDKSRHNAADMELVLREAFGEDTGSAAAKGLAKAWTDTAEWLRRRANAAGMSIKKLENWGLPQYHNPLALMKAGLEQWKKDIGPKLDIGRMRNPITDLPLAPGEVDQMLNSVFDSIVTEGWNAKEPSRMPAGLGALYNRHQDHRFLIFNNAKDWQAYQKLYGQGDPFASMMGYVNRMARDIAHMERFGPNPQATVNWLKQSVEQAGKMAAAGKSDKLKGLNGQAAADHAAKAVYKIDALWQTMRGTTNTPVNSRFAMVMDTGRNFVFSAVMGSSAIVSVFGDTGASLVARSFAGLPMTGLLRDLLHGMTRAGRREATGAWLINEEAMHVFGEQARYVGTLSGPEWTRWLSDRVLTVSGLTPWTQAARHAAGLSMMRQAADYAGRSFEALPAAWKDNFWRWGITPEQWDKMRSAPLNGITDGGKLLRPNEIAAIDEGLARRWNEIVQQEMEYHVPTGSVRSRTALVGAGRPGTVLGEVLRSGAMLKGFTVHQFLLYTMRYMPMIMSKNMGTKAWGAAYAGGTLITLTMMGALGIQLRQIKDGKDPLDMTTPSFWGAAALQGGGLGLFGDFLFSQLNRFGSGPAATLQGPTGQRITDLLNYTFGNVAEAITSPDHRPKNFGKETVKIIGENVPLVNSVWYMSLAYKRLVLDQLQYLMDPHANQDFKRRIAAQRHDYNQEFWWQPGQTSPARPPDLSAALPH